jgi:hypothetical protein
MVHGIYRNINALLRAIRLIYIGNLYLNTLGKHTKILKFLSFFFFFFDNLLPGSIKITIKFLL